MDTRFSIFGCLLLICALFSILMVPQSVMAADNITSVENQHARTAIACPTTTEWKDRGDHNRAYTPYPSNCDSKLTIREAVSAIENSDIYYNDTRRNGFLVRFTGDLIFANGVADLPVESNATLQQFADILKNYDNAVTVRGHASTPNISSNQFPSNQVLSEERAKSVANHLTYQNGVSTNRLSTKGFGERLQYNEEINDATERLNRRVDFFIQN